MTPEAERECLTFLRGIPREWWAANAALVFSSAKALTRLAAHHGVPSLLVNARYSLDLAIAYRERALEMATDAEVTL